MSHLIYMYYSVYKTCIHAQLDNQIRFIHSYSYSYN